MSQGRYNRLSAAAIAEIRHSYALWRAAFERHSPSAMARKYGISREWARRIGSGTAGKKPAKG